MTVRFMSGLGLAMLLLLGCAFSIGYWAQGRKADVGRRRRQRKRGGRRTIPIDQLTAGAGDREPDQPSC